MSPGPALPVAFGSLSNVTATAVGVLARVAILGFAMWTSAELAPALASGLLEFIAMFALHMTLDEKALAPVVRSTLNLTSPA